MTFSVAFTNKEPKTADTIVIGVFEGQDLSTAAKSIDKRTKSLLSQTLKGHKNFEGKTGQTLSMAFSIDKAVRVVLLGLGLKDEAPHLDFETIGGKLYDALKNSSAQNINILCDGITQKNSEAKMISHIAYGFLLKSYNFDKYRAKPKDNKVSISKLVLITQAHTEAKKIYAALNSVAEGVFLARDLVNEPPNMLYPVSYVERIKKELKPLGVEIEILDEKKLEKLGFEALLAVGQGSIRDSQVAIMRWNGTSKGKSKKPAKAPIAFVGKGVTFDTGGISLKPGAEMDLMKMDMGGSAAVVGLMKALASRKAKADVIGIVGLVENMPSDRAYRPGDIIGSLAGKTIEVLNTDAEGRLVLADVITYVQNTYKPEVVIDLATLTGAIMVALGYEYCGAFANDDGLWDQLKEASDNTGEKFWRMPLDQAYRDEMVSTVADLKNLGSLGRYGGACSAAGFLEHFVTDKTKWAHIDIAGTAWWKSDRAITPKGGTGFPVRALNDLVEKHFEK